MKKLQIVFVVLGLAAIMLGSSACSTGYVCQAKKIGNHASR